MLLVLNCLYCCFNAAGKENFVNGGSDLQDLLAKADALHSKGEPALPQTQAAPSSSNCHDSTTYQAMNMPWQYDFLTVPPFTQLTRRCAVAPAAEKPREHAVDAEVFAQLAQCGLAMIKQGQALNQVCHCSLRPAIALLCSVSASL